MNVLVVGATGATGTLAVRELLRRDHTVSALARSPAAFTDTHPRLRVVQGDGRDGASIDRAVQGQDAVLVAVGPRSLRGTDLQEVLAGHLVAAMKAHGVKRLVNLSAWGVSANDAPVGLVARLFMAVFLRSVYADKRRGEAILDTSGLQVVQVRPGRLIDDPARGGVKASVDGAGLSPVMTRADLAVFMVDQLSEDTWVGKGVVIGY